MPVIQHLGTAIGTDDGDGLVFHFDASNSTSYSGSGSTSWNDLSGNGNHATLIGPPSYSTANGGYLDFDGFYFISRARELFRNVPRVRTI